MYDIILKNGKIIDGKGNPWYQGDIGVKDGFIKHIGKIDIKNGRKIIDVDNKVICPGFIDVHSHSDYVFFIDGTAQSKIRQGVTTEVTGNCGFSVAPNINDSLKIISFFEMDTNPDWVTFEDYADALSKLNKTVNIAPLIGHGTLRAAVMGTENRSANKKEIKRMQDILADCLEAGALGLSLGLYFAPGAYAEENELIALSETLSSYGRVLTGHIRDEGSRSVGFINAVKEVINIAKKASVSLNISHIKAFGPDVWGQSKDILKLIENARAEGYDVTCDQYPYAVTGGDIAHDTLPVSFLSGKTSGKIVEELQKDEVKKELKDIIATNIAKRGGEKNQTIANFPYNPSLEGKTLAKISEEFESDPADTVIKMIIKGKCTGNWVSKALHDDDVERFMKYPATMISSDGRSLSLKGPLSKGQPHPRNFGAFTHALEHYVNKLNVITLEDAIRKMTSLPAQKFSLYKRGSLEVNNWADITVLDIGKIKSSSFDNPKKYPTGVSYVLVNGELILENGSYTGALTGRFCRLN